jgi:hypothetical protein
MRILLTILLFSSKAFATNYYISNTGSDAANGLSTVTAWQTIAKVNATATRGDSVYFKRGDIWNEKLTPASSNIYFGAYGTGLKPLITGFQPLSMSSIGSNLYTGTATNSVLKQNTVLINGQIRYKGRYPNPSFQAVTFPFGWHTGIMRGSNATDTMLVSDQHFPSDPTGAEIAARPYSFLLDVAKISYRSGDTIKYYPPLTYAPGGTVTDFHVQNLANLCDQQNEWAYDSTTKLITIYSTSLPTVKYSSIDTLVNLHRKDSIHFENITFEGANKILISADTNRVVTTLNCGFKNAFNGVVLNKSSLFVSQSDSMNDLLNDGIFTAQLSDSGTVYNGTFRNIGMFYGMGANANNAYLAIFNAGTFWKIKYNRIDSIGFNGISFNGAKDTIQYNYITNTCQIKEDAGAIYTSVVAPNTGSYVGYNIIENTPGFHGANQRTASTMYFDSQTSGVTYEYNSGSNAFTYGVFVNGGSNFTIRNNTQIDSLANPFVIPGGFNTTGTTIRRNIFYSKNAANAVMYISNVHATSNSDSNAVLRPSSTANIFRFDNTTYGMASWRTAKTWETHSDSAVAASNDAAPLYYTNPSTSNRIISLNGSYIDANGVVYNNTITIPPYQSALLFYASTQPRYSFRLKGFKFY